tara:strand:- start:2174 stop:2668 length:495 start_codon:yes stop_codon:yes gene_type:complete
MSSNKRYNGAIALIKSQTNYNDEEAKEKLEKWEGNYMNVIKEYLNPNFNKKKIEKKRTTNENMMCEIRNFMDNAHAGYLKRKEEEKKKTEYLKKVYDTFLKVKSEYPDCKYNPPKIISCDTNCKNPLCPGELLPDNSYSKMLKQSSNEKDKCIPCESKNEKINL